MCRNQQGTKNLFKYMSEITWTRRHDQITMYDDMKDDTKNNVVVCSENMSVKQAIYDYMSLYSFYVEQLHYNNNGQLDAFIDHEVICLLKIMNMIFVNRFVSHYIKNTIFTISNGQINQII